MNKIQFLNLLNDLIIKIKQNYSDNLFEQIQEKFKNYLKDNANDMEIWIKYALIFYHIRYDELETMKILANALDYDQDHVVTRFILAYVINYDLYPNIEVFEIACNTKTMDLEYLSMQEYIKSWYYCIKDRKMQKKALINSINYCDSFVWNYKHLGLYYLHEEKNYKEAGYCFQKALSNIQYVYNLKGHYDPLNIEEFINERLKGIHVIELGFERLQQLLESCK